jgi:uncharacterized protein (TIGR02246 family)
MTTVDDKLAIQELVAAYNWAWDHGDWDGVVACFTPDGIFVDAAGGEHAGADAIRRFAEGSPGAFGAMRHITSSHHVTHLGEDRARHRCYMVFLSHPEGERTLDTAEYEDELVRVDGAWRFVRRVVRFD